MSLLLLTDSHHLCSSEEKMRGHSHYSLLECAQGHAASPEASGSGDLVLAGHEDPSFAPFNILLAWPKQAKIGFHDRPIICVLGLQGMSSNVCFGARNL